MIGACCILKIQPRKANVIISIEIGTVREKNQFKTWLKGREEEGEKNEKERTK